MLTRRAKLGLILLSTFFFSIIVLSWMLQGMPLVLFELDPLSVPINGQVINLPMGQTTLQMVLLVLALLILDLTNEFYSLQTVFHVSCATALSLILLWGTLWITPFFPIVENADKIGAIKQTLFGFSRKELISILATITVGFWMVSILFHIIRKLARGHFSLIRLFFAHTLGLALLTALTTYWIFYPNIVDQNKILEQFLPQYSQWFVISLIAYPVYYILKLPLLIIIGKEHYRYIQHYFGPSTTPQPIKKSTIEKLDRTQIEGK